MAVLKRAAVDPPTLPKETVEVQALGGDVVVRGLMLTERMALEQKIVTLTRKDKPAAPDALDPDVNVVLPMLLSMAVLDADGVQFWSEHQWQIFGGKEPQQAVALFNVAWRLAGLDTAANKKN